MKSQKSMDRNMNYDITGMTGMSQMKDALA